MCKLALTGLLADAVLELAAFRRASVCLVPCCYGQIVSALDHKRGSNTTPNMHPRSAEFRSALVGEESGAFRTVAKAADFSVVQDGEFALDSPAFATAQRCMRIVDTDRLLWVREQSNTHHQPPPLVFLSRLEPPTCRCLEPPEK